MSANKLFIARTKSGLEENFKFRGLDRSNYVIFHITDKVRENKVIKSLAGSVADENFKYMAVLKDFVVVTTEGAVSVNTPALAENEYARELNTPEEEAPGDKSVEDGQLKGIFSKLLKGQKLTKSERAVANRIVKAWGTHDGEPVPANEQVVEELDDATAKAFDAVEGAEDEEKGDDDEEAVTKSALDSNDLRVLAEQARRARVEGGPRAILGDLALMLKSYGSLSNDAPVFQSKMEATRFAQAFNIKSQSQSGDMRAEVRTATRAARSEFGNLAKFVVEIS